MQRLVGNYALEQPLGRGGMSSVWLARRVDGRFEGRAAIKFLDLALVDAQGVERFRREGQVLARLDHANIARLIDAGVTDDGQPYLVLEYVEGERLDRWGQSRSLDVRARVRLFLEVLAAVAHAHSKLILHRDLKPANILVTPDGQVKLLDFGTAKILDLGAATPSVPTTAHAHAFTIDYASPEQVQGGEVTTATDVYALGVILFELLTGRHPTAHAAQTPMAKTRAIVETEPARALRGDLDNILAMALRKAPDERYQTAEAFADDLRSYLNGDPVRARADSAWYRFGKFLVRNRIAACTAMVVLAAIAVAGGISLQQKREATTQRDRARALSARSSAVIDFVNSMLADVAPAQGAISIADLMERSYSKLATGTSLPDHEAAVLALVAQFYSNNGNPLRADQMLATSLDLTRDSTDKPLRGLLLCQGASVGAALGRLDQAKVALDEGLGLVGEDDLATVTCYETAASLAQAANDPDRALVLVLRAQERLRESGVVRPDWDAVLRARIGDMQFMRGNTVEAERYYADSLARLAQIGRGESVATYAVRSRWARVAAEAGDTLRALSDYEELLRIADASSLSGKPPAWLVGARGSMLSQLARYPEALAVFDEGIELATRSENMYDVAIDRVARADILVSLGRVDQAEQELQKLASLMTTSIGREGSVTQRVTRVRARIAAAENRLPDAIAGYSELIALPGVAKVMLTRALVERADLYLKTGASDLALADAQRSLELARALQRDKPYSAFTGRALAALSRCQQATAATSEAKVTAGEAAINLAKTLGDDHPDTQWARRAAQL
jgi:tetratricopeptide (TPR) repeat protein/predicted Ser/Thr protein kinase